VVVGDRVHCETGQGGGVLTAVEERRNAFHRQVAGGRDEEQVVAANVDHVVVVASATAPEYRVGFVDRVLVQAAQCGLAASLALNKVDLLDPPGVEAIAAPYRTAGYRVLPVSAKRGTGVNELRQECDGRRTLFVGQSGVGKSTLLNAISPGLGLGVGEVNPKTFKGRHTTSTAWLLRLPPALEVIDTPGMRALGLWGVEPERLVEYFPDLAAHAVGCRFLPCTHQDEPECAVRAAAESGVLDAGRYRSYLKLRAELETERPRHHGRPRRGRFAGSRRR
jgi:ribosome biogenesis GTPase